MATFVIADDSKLARKLLKTILLEHGHEVIAEATDGLEAYNLYGKLIPEIMILDITMPVLDGMATLKMIKADFPQAKIIIVSSIGKESSKTEAISAGAVNYIVKPYEVEQVIDAVELCIRA